LEKQIKTVKLIDESITMHRKKRLGFIFETIVFSFHLFMKGNSIRPLVETVVGSIVTIKLIYKFAVVAFINFDEICKNLAPELIDHSK
jgi:hypothetical protein